MKNRNSNNTSASSDSRPRWVPCIAKADFWGDSRATQLSFRKNTRFEVDLRKYPNNGWRWGKTSDRMGWFPDWAAEPLSSTTSQQLSAPSSLSPSHNKQRRLRDRISPMLDRIGQQQQQQLPDDNDNDDNSSNRIKSGKLTRVKTMGRIDPSDVVGLQPRSGRRHSHSNNSIHSITSTSSSSQRLSWMEKLSVMAARGQQNPSTTKAHQNNSDWVRSETAPQIVNSTDGTNPKSSYRNEKSYKSAKAVSRLAEITGIKMPKRKSGGSSRNNRSFSTCSLSSNASMCTNKSNSNESGAKNNNSNSNSNSNLLSKPSNRLFGKFPKLSSFSKQQVTIVNNDQRRRSSSTKPNTVAYSPAA